MNSKNYILSISPLSQSFIEKLETEAGQNFQIIFASSLRQYSGWGLIRYLRSLPAQMLVIAVEDPESLIALPILLLLAMIVPAKKRRLYVTNQGFNTLDWFKSLSSVLKFLTHSAGAQISRWFFIGKIKKHYATAQPILMRSTTDKMLYINENLWFGLKAGGSVGHIAGVINELHQQQYQVNYAAINANPQINQEINHLNLPCLKTFVYPNELNYPRFSNLNIKYLRRWIKINKPSFIYQRLSIGNYAGAVLSKELNIPLILEYNGSEVWCFEKWGAGLKYKTLPTLAEKFNLKQATYIVTISKNLQIELEGQGIPRQKIICYPNCFDPVIFNPQRFTHSELSDVRQQYKIPRDATLLTFIGTFGKWHGTEILAKSIKYLMENKTDWLNKHKVHFLLIGDGTQMPTVKNILAETANSDFVTLTGIIPQHLSPLHLAASDIVLSPHIPNADGSRFFGSPTKLFEYMAMGKGIIASDIEQIGEVLKNSLHADKLDSNQNPQDNLAILCRPGNIQDLTQAMMFLVENPQIRVQLGMNARQKALTTYTWKNHVETILKSIHSSI